MLPPPILLGRRLASKIRKNWILAAVDNKSRAKRPFFWNVLSKKIAAAWNWTEADRSMPYSVTCLTI
jgi:hypothetical protein